MNGVTGEEDQSSSVQQQTISLSVEFWIQSDLPNRMLKILYKTNSKASDLLQAALMSITHSTLARGFLVPTKRVRNGSKTSSKNVAVFKSTFSTSLFISFAAE